MKTGQICLRVGGTSPPNMGREGDFAEVQDDAAADAFLGPVHHHRVRKGRTASALSRTDCTACCWR